MPEPEGLDAVPDLETLSFEEAFRRLGDTAEALETGGLPLAEATAVFERGMALVQRCNQLLNETQLKITELKESYADSPSRDDSDWEKESDF